MSRKGKCPRGSLISGWEQQIRKEDIQREGRLWEETEELCEDRGRWRRAVVRRPT
jgi:NADPH-dependent glutamate synthase beta subunit-like oxidoreductase